MRQCRWSYDLTCVGVDGHVTSRESCVSLDGAVAVVVVVIVAVAVGSVFCCC